VCVCVCVCVCVLVRGVNRYAHGSRAIIGGKGISTPWLSRPLVVAPSK